MLELGCGSDRVVPGLPAEASVGFLFFSYHNDARSNKHQNNLHAEIPKLYFVTK